MKKIIILSLLVMGLITATAQNKDALKIAHIEKEFAKLSVETNTRNAFINYFADGIIFFRRGEIVDGKQLWEKRKADSSELFWYPSYVDIAGSDDIGLSTGPVHYKASRKNQATDNYGYYASVWKKMKDGNWKVIVDLGISDLQPLPKSGLVVYSQIKSNAVKNADTNKIKKQVISLENKLIKNYAAKGNIAYSNLLSKEARIFRPAKMPYIQKDSLAKFMYSPSTCGSFEMANSIISSTGDFVFIYGYAKNKEANWNYLRIWKNEKNKGWRIVLEMVTD